MSGPNTNTGHGHVWTRPDGMRARCGGPAICLQCASDLATWGSHNKAANKVAETLTHVGVNSGQIVELGFASFLAVCFKGQALGNDQRQQLRDAFFAGAQHLFASIMTILDPGEEPTEADLARMESIHRELETFAGELGRRVYRTDGATQ